MAYVRTALLIAGSAAALAACGSDTHAPLDPRDPATPPPQTFVPNGVPTPGAVATNMTFAVLSTGEDHTCGITTTAQAWCWGVHAIGTTSSWGQRPAYPWPVDGQRQYVSIAAGRSHTCATSTAGEVFCWGRETPFGAMQGNGSWDAPRRLDPDPAVTNVVSGGSFSCGLRRGAAVCWGHNLWGELGSGDPLPAARQAAVSGGLRFKRLGSVIGHTICGITDDDRLFCWGRGDLGQLGAGAPDSCYGGPCAAAPVAIMPDTRFRSVSTGPSHACAVSLEGEAWCWGLNGEENRLGSTAVARAPGANSEPVRITVDARFTEVSTGHDHACALAVDTTVWCWGSNAHGQLGAGLATEWWLPSQVLGSFNQTPLGFLSISSGNRFSCGIAIGNRAYCWGRRGEHLGRGTTSS